MKFGVFLCVPSLEDITIFKSQTVFNEYICLLLSACTLLKLLVVNVNNRNTISCVLVFASLISRILAKKNEYWHTIQRATVTLFATILLNAAAGEI